MTTRNERIVAHGLIRRDAIERDQDASTRGKIDVFRVRSQNPKTPDAIYTVGLVHRDNTVSCSCKAFAVYGYCKHSDSVEFYVLQRSCGRVIDNETDDYLAKRDNELAIREMREGLYWDERAEWAALGEEIARRLDADERSN